MFSVRRLLTHVDDTYHDSGPRLAQPVRRGAALVVVQNPFSGRYEPNLEPAMDLLKPIGLDLAQRLLMALGVGPSAITGYGKAAIVGAGGELEHGALWHVPGGYAMRETLGWKEEKTVTNRAPGNALAIVPSTKKIGAPGTRIDVPLTHINASYVRSHLDAIEVGSPGAPRSDEIVFILAMSIGPRVHARLGGLRTDQIERWDGQR